MLQIFLVAVLLVVIIAGFISTARKRKGLPPGPFCFPFLGYLPFIDKNSPFNTIEQLRQKYGDIFYVKLGVRNVVFISDYQIAAEVFGDSDFIGRPDFYTFRTIYHGKLRGITGTSGKLWEEQRRFVFRTLRDFGFGKSSLEDIILTETDHVIQEFIKKRGEPFMITNAFHVAMVNIIWSFISGERMIESDPQSDKIMTGIHLSSESASVSILDYIPWLRMFISDKCALTDVIKTKNCSTLPYFTRLVKEHERTYDPSCKRDLIDVYLTKMYKDERNNVEDSTFTSFSCGVHFNLAVTRTGSVFARGFNDSGQLGDGTTKKTASTFAEIEGGLADKKVIQARAGGWHSLALTSSGLVYGWGRTDNYELGKHDEELVLLPQRIPINGHVVLVDCGDKLSGALTDDGRVFLFGSIWKMNTWICLWKTPTELKLKCKTSRSCLGTSDCVIDMCLGNSHVVCLTQDQRVFTIGLNEHGCLGNNEKLDTLEMQPNLVDISSIDDVLVNHFGTFTACRLSTGKLLIWGQTKVGSETLDVIKPSTPDCKDCKRKCRTLNDLHANHCMSPTMKDALTASANKIATSSKEDVFILTSIERKLEMLERNEADILKLLKELGEQSSQEVKTLGQTLEKRTAESTELLKEAVAECKESIEKMRMEHQKEMDDNMRTIYKELQSVRDEIRNLQKQ